MMSMKYKIQIQIQNTNTNTKLWYGCCGREALALHIDAREQEVCANAEISKKYKIQIQIQSYDMVC